MTVHTLHNADAGQGTEAAMTSPDPLAVTVDAQGRRWIRCARCVGSGRVGVQGVYWELCPDCNGEGQVEVP